jgi:hypothetical protein
MALPSMNPGGVMNIIFLDIDGPMIPGSMLLFNALADS